MLCYVMFLPYSDSLEVELCHCECLNVDFDSDACIIRCSGEAGINEGTWSKRGV